MVEKLEAARSILILCCSCVLPAGISVFIGSIKGLHKFEAFTYVK